MKNIYSNILNVNKNSIAKAIKYLKNNKLVGVPTETVYGLSGNAYSDLAVKKIYSTKKRPKYNPLIIHYYDIKKLSSDAHLNTAFFKLYEKFCPGPITFVLKKKASSKVSKLATSNLETIAVRFPRNKIIRNILKTINLPLAIPSANKSGGISPVRAVDIIEEFGSKIKIILDGGSCTIGIESTVVDLTSDIKILRPGAISPEKIGVVLNKSVKFIKQKKIKSPGAIKKHYSPGIPKALNQKKAPNNGAFITFGKRYKKKYNYFNLSEDSNLNQAAKNLYKTLRIIKKKKFKKIYVIKISQKGIGAAINNRLKHAAAK